MPERRVGNLIFLPNKFDDCPLEEAIKECQTHFLDRFKALQTHRYKENWSNKRWKSEVRNLADESWHARQHDE